MTNICSGCNKRINDETMLRDNKRNKVYHNKCNPNKKANKSVSKTKPNLAPNGKPSNLTSEQYKLVRTKAFKKWFGDWEYNPKHSSKIVDENGEPLICYHGYMYGGGAGRKFYQFKSLPAYFSLSYDFAYDYADTKSMDGGLDADIGVYACFLNIRKYFNPLDNPVDAKLAKQKLPKKITISHGTFWFLTGDVSVDDLIEEMRGIQTILPSKMAKAIKSAKVGDTIKEQVASQQYEYKILVWKNDEWAYIVDKETLNIMAREAVADHIFDSKSIKYKGEYIDEYIMNEKTWRYELNKDPRIKAFHRDVRNEIKSYFKEVSGKIKQNNYPESFNLKRDNFTKHPYSLYFRRVNLKRYKEPCTENWTLYENQTVMKFLKDNKFDGWKALERNKATIGVFDAKNIKLADGTNTKFDPNSNDIRKNPNKKAPAKRKANKTKLTNYRKLIKEMFDIVEQYPDAPQMRVGFEDWVYEATRTKDNQKINMGLETINAMKAMVINRTKPGDPNRVRITELHDVLYDAITSNPSFIETQFNPSKTQWEGAIGGEGWAIQDYKNMLIGATTKERKVIKHIIAEEEEHLQELLSLYPCSNVRSNPPSPGQVCATYGAFKNPRITKTQFFKSQKKKGYTHEEIDYMWAVARTMRNNKNTKVNPMNNICNGCKNPIDDETMLKDKKRNKVYHHKCNPNKNKNAKKIKQLLSGKGDSYYCTYCSREHKSGSKIHNKHKAYDFSKISRSRVKEMKKAYAKKSNPRGYSTIIKAIQKNIDDTYKELGFEKTVEQMGRGTLQNIYRYYIEMSTLFDEALTKNDQKKAGYVDDYAQTGLADELVKMEDLFVIIEDYDRDRKSRDKLQCWIENRNKFRKMSSHQVHKFLNKCMPRNKKAPAKKSNPAYSLKKVSKRKYKGNNKYEVHLRYGGAGYEHSFIHAKTRKEAIEKIQKQLEKHTASKKPTARSNPRTKKEIFAALIQKGYNDVDAFTFYGTASSRENNKREQAHKKKSEAFFAVYLDALTKEEKTEFENKYPSMIAWFRKSRSKQQYDTFIKFYVFTSYNTPTLRKQYRTMTEKKLLEAQIREMRRPEHIRRRKPDELTGANTAVDFKNLINGVRGEFASFWNEDKNKKSNPNTSTKYVLEDDSGSWFGPFITKNKAYEFGDLMGQMQREWRVIPFTSKMKSKTDDPVKALGEHVRMLTEGMSKADTLEYFSTGDSYWDMVGWLNKNKKAHAKSKGFDYYKFHLKGDLHRNVLLNILEYEYGITFRDYDLSQTGIKAKNIKTEKVLKKLFKGTRNDNMKKTSTKRNPKFKIGDTITWLASDGAYTIDTIYEVWTEKGQQVIETDKTELVFKGEELKLIKKHKTLKNSPTKRNPSQYLGYPAKKDQAPKLTKIPQSKLPKGWTVSKHPNAWNQYNYKKVLKTRTIRVEPYIANKETYHVELWIDEGGHYKQIKDKNYLKDKAATDKWTLEFINNYPKYYKAYCERSNKKAPAKSNPKNISASIRRAKKIAKLLASNKLSNLNSRSYDQLFEQGDGDEVAKHIAIELLPYNISTFNQLGANARKHASSDWFIMAPEQMAIEMVGKKEYDNLPKASKTRILNKIKKSDATQLSSYLRLSSPERVKSNPKHFHEIDYPTLYHGGERLEFKYKGKRHKGIAMEMIRKIPGKKFEIEPTTGLRGKSKVFKSGYNYAIPYEDIIKKAPAKKSNPESKSKILYRLATNVIMAYNMGQIDSKQSEADYLNQAQGQAESLTDTEQRQLYKQYPNLRSYILSKGRSKSNYKEAKTEAYAIIKKYERYAKKSNPASRSNPRSERSIIRNINKNLEMAEDVVACCGSRTEALQYVNNADALFLQSLTIQQQKTHTRTRARLDRVWELIDASFPGKKNTQKKKAPAKKSNPQPRVGNQVNTPIGQARLVGLGRGIATVFHPDKGERMFLIEQISIMSSNPKIRGKVFIEGDIDILEMPKTPKRKTSHPPLPPPPTNGLQRQMPRTTAQKPAKPRKSKLYKSKPGKPLTTRQKFINWHIGRGTPKAEGIELWRAKQEDAKANRVIKRERARAKRERKAKMTASKGKKPTYPTPPKDVIEKDVKKTLRDISKGLGL